MRLARANTHSVGRMRQTYIFPGTGSNTRYRLIAVRTGSRGSSGLHSKRSPVTARTGVAPWQVRKVRDYIDSHIAGRVLVADLCALIQRSDAHFSRAFRRTFGESPYAFMVRRRVELAAKYMLTSDASLSDIALRCGFSDQAHLGNHFRQAMGQTPAAWRRAHRLCLDEDEPLPVERYATTSHNGSLVPV